MYRILVLGGYGNFGTRICNALSGDPNIQLFVAGRSLDRANTLLRRLENRDNHVAISIDQNSSEFIKRLESLNVDCLIHTSGPYQGQDYSVAEACIQTKTHYIDLADGRSFVEGFTNFNNEAKDKDVLLVTGASTLPGLSSAVIKHFKHEFNSIESIKTCITPGNKAPRGESTIAAVLSYCGKPILCWVNGEWKTLFGWQDIHAHDFPKLGKRWLGICDVPDLSLFPERYTNTKTVLFHAALETKTSQFGFWLIASLSRLGIIKNPDRHAKLIKKIGDVLNFMGTPDGGMFINLIGKDQDNKLKELTWYLTALNGHGPEIPIIPAIILAKKLANKDIAHTGAMPCFELISLNEFDDAVAHLDISWEIVRH